MCLPNAFSLVSSVVIVAYYLVSSERLELEKDHAPSTVRLAVVVKGPNE